MIELNENVAREMNKYLEGITIEEIFILLKEVRRHFISGDFYNEQMKQDVEVLDLSVRAYHCLKRAGYHTLERLGKWNIYKRWRIQQETAEEESGILEINSADEILIKLMNYQFNPAGQQEKGIICSISLWIIWEHIW